MQLNNRQLSKQEEGMIVHKVKIHIGLQRSDAEIEQIEGWTEGTARSLRRRVLQAEADSVANSTTEEIYAEYRLHAASAVEQLNTTITKHSSASNNAMAIVQAVRAKMDIIKEVIKTGQEFGLVDKKAEIKGLLVAGVDLSKASPNERQQLIDGEMLRIQNLLTKASKPILDVTPQ